MTLVLLNCLSVCHTGEIGVPPYFAMRLSFPEAVTPHNVEHLRQLVRNGAHKYPGALAVEDCTGRVIQLSRLEEKQREAMAKQLMLPSFAAGVKKGPSGRGKTVYRWAGLRLAADGRLC